MAKAQSSATSDQIKHLQRIKSLLDDPVADQVDKELEEHFGADEAKRKAINSLEEQTMALALSEDQKRGRPIYQSLMLRGLDGSYTTQEEAEISAPNEGTHVWTKKLDDVEDKDELRNNKQTLQSFANEEIIDDEEIANWITVNHIIGLRSRNYRAITESDNLSDSEKLSILETLWEAEQDLAEGQNYDILGSKIAENPELKEKLTYEDEEFDMMDYLVETNHLKTAPLFRASAEMVEEITGYEGEELTDSANETGQAFQIWDDALDFQNGRNSDIEEANYTILLYIAENYLKTHPEQKYNLMGELLEEVLADQNPNDEEIEMATRIIREETPAIEASQNLSEYLISKANSNLDQVNWENPEYAEELKEFNELLGYERPK